VTASVRNTEVTAFVLETCAHGMPTTRVLDEMARRWPPAAADAGERLLRELIDRGFLLHDLLPDDPRRDPLRHLLDRIPPGFPHRGCLERLRELLGRLSIWRTGGPARPRGTGTAARLSCLLMRSALFAGLAALAAGAVLMRRDPPALRGSYSDFLTDEAMSVATRY